jgi:hypothetical protein
MTVRPKGPFCQERSPLAPGLAAHVPSINHSKIQQVAEARHCSAVGSSGSVQLEATLLREACGAVAS